MVKLMFALALTLHWIYGFKGNMAQMLTLMRQREGSHT